MYCYNSILQYRLHSTTPLRSTPLHSTQLFTPYRFYDGCMCRGQRYGDPLKWSKSCLQNLRTWCFCTIYMYFYAVFPYQHFTYMPLSKLYVYFLWVDNPIDQGNSPFPPTNNGIESFFVLIFNRSHFGNNYTIYRM